MRKCDQVAQLKRNAPQLSFAHGSTLHLLGKEITIVVEPTEKKRTTVRLDGAALIVQTAKPHGGDPHGSEARGAVVAWCKYTARRIIPERVEQLNASVGFQYKGAIVRDQKTRWGSCSRRGTLSLNWRLLLVPPSVMDYLIYHELAHLKEMNHSIRFWRLVQQLCPSFREAEGWLKKNGSLMFW